MEGKLTNVLMGTEKTALFIRLFICPSFPVVVVVKQKSFFFLLSDSIIFPS